MTAVSGSRSRSRSWSSSGLGTASRPRPKRWKEARRRTRDGFVVRPVLGTGLKAEGAPGTTTGPREAPRMHSSAVQLSCRLVPSTGGWYAMVDGDAIFSPVDIVNFDLSLFDLISGGPSLLGSVAVEVQECQNKQSPKRLYTSHGTKATPGNKTLSRGQRRCPRGQVNKARTLPLTEPLGHSGIVEEHLACCNIQSTAYMHQFKLFVCIWCKNLKCRNRDVAQDSIVIPHLLYLSLLGLFFFSQNTKTGSRSTMAQYINTFILREGKISSSANTPHTTPPTTLPPSPSGHPILHLSTRPPILHPDLSPCRATTTPTLPSPRTWV